MIILIEELLIQIIIWELKLINQLNDLLNTSINYDKKQDILTYFFTNSLLGNIFKGLIIVTIGLAAICSVAAIIKNMIINKTLPRLILGKFLGSVIAVFVVTMFWYLGLMLNNLLLNIWAETFYVESSLDLSKLILFASTKEWLNGYSINEIEISTLELKTLIGSYDNFNTLPTIWNYNGMINPANYYYLLSFITTNMVLISFFIMIIRIIKRFYEIIMLFFIMPLSLCTFSIDDGARFNNWLRILSARFLIIFGSIISFNVFNLVFPIILNWSCGNANQELEQIVKLLIVISGAVSMMVGQKFLIQLFSNNNIKKQKRYCCSNYYTYTTHQYFETYKR